MNEIIVKYLRVLSVDIALDRLARTPTSLPHASATQRVGASGLPGRLALGLLWA